MPPVTRIVETVRLPDAARAYYNKAEIALRRARTRFEIESSFLRMRQISSGFLGYKEFTDENSEKWEKAEFVFPENPKPDRLVELIQEMPTGRKAVVFYEFTHSGRSVTQALKKVGISAGWLWSGTKNSRDLLRQFDDDPGLRVLVANWKIASMALNLQVANYTFMYESPVSPIKREQAEHRCFRDGQTRPGFLVDLVCQGTQDQHILDMLAEGEDLFEALVKRPSRIPP